MTGNIHDHDHPYSLRRRRCLAIAHRAARAAFPMHLKISAKHGGDESKSSKALHKGADIFMQPITVINYIHPTNSERNKRRKKIRGLGKIEQFLAATQTFRMKAPSDKTSRNKPPKIMKSLILKANQLLHLIHNSVI